MQAESTPSVFISYSHDSPEHEKQVLELAQQLRAHGVAALIDQFVNGHPEEGWPAWMIKEIRNSDFVLIVCSPVYRTRFERQELPGRGLGATWEAILTQQELYEAQGRNKKFLPLVFGQEPLDSVPALLRQYQIYRLMNDYTALLRVLLDQPGVVPAPLAPPVRLAGDATGPSAIAAAPGLPLPLAQTLLRSINAKSASDAWLSAHRFFETAMELSAAAQIALYARFGPVSPAVNGTLEPGNWGSAEQWLEVFREIGAHMRGAAPEARAVLGDVGARLTANREWGAAAELLKYVGADDGKPSSALDVFRAIVRERSLAEHGSESARLIRDAVLETLRFVQPFGDCRLAVGTYITGDTGGAYAYQYLSLHGDGLRLPLAAKPRGDGSGRPREGDLWWVGEGEPLPLTPFAAYESGFGAAERFGLLHAGTDAGEAPDGNTRKRRLSYLDFQSGDYLGQRDAELEIGLFLGRIWGRSVSPAEVRTLAEDTDRRAPAAADGGRWIGDFQILGELGRGAMGVVYKARQGSLGRVVALKVLPAGAAVDALAARRFLLEIEALGRCDHPNVVKVLTAGRDRDCPFYAMEFVEGSDLARVYAILNGWRHSHPGHLTEGHLLGAISSSGGAAAGQPDSAAAPAAAPEIDAAAFAKLAGGKDYYRRLAEIMADAARGVQHLHDHRILHRDLKPANLMLTRDGNRAVVMDLGLAKATDGPSLAGSSQVRILGTLRYMAPEQLQRKLIELTPQADIYGLGATLYELACLAPMFDGDSEERLAAQVLWEDPPSPRKRNPELPRPLALIISKATAKVPAARYVSAAEMAEDLDSFARDGFTIHARPPSAPQRARKYAARHKPLATAVAASVLALALGLWWWDYNRLKTYAYAGAVMVRQVPVGTVRVSASQAQRMDSHTELQFRRGKLVVRRSVNSAGRLLNGGESEWHYHYRQDSSLESVEGFDHNHILKRVRTISPDATVVEFKDKGGTAMTSRLEGVDAGAGGSEIARTHVEYDPSGHERVVLYQNSFGKPEPGSDGNFGAQYERDAQGFIIRSWELDINGQKKSSFNGIFETHYDIGKWGFPTRVCNLTESGEPAVNAEGYSCRSYERDDVGNMTFGWNLGRGGNRVMAKYGCAGGRTVYDQHGFVTENTCLDVHGNAVDNKDGVASRRSRYDPDGNMIEARVYGPDGKLTYQQQGIAIFKRRYDAAGNIIESEYFGVDGQPVPDEHGHHRVVDTYMNGRRVREEQYGIDGRLVRTKSMMPITTLAYDDHGDEIEARFFDENRQPANNEDGAHRVQLRYDERGNRVERIFFDNRGNRATVPRFGYAGETDAYDSQGHRTEARYFGPDGNPVELREGYHRWTGTYNDFGEEKEEAYFGVDGSPAMRYKAFHKVTYAYDDRGQVTEVVFFGADGKSPAAYTDGIHRRVRNYDHRGNLIEVANFGTSGQPALTRNGYHILRARYDDSNRRTDESYWGVHGEPALTLPLRVHRLTEKYDPRGNVIEVAYFDAAEKPCNSVEGFQRLVQRYDERGYQIEQSYFGPNGEKVVSRAGDHRRVDVYDAHGNVVEQSFYGPDDKLTLSSGRAIVRITYDVHGNELETAYYGVHNELVRRNEQPIAPQESAEFKRRNGAARIVYTYDDGNRRTLEQFFGPDDKPTENVFGAAQVRFVYGADGKRVEKWYRLNGAEIPAKSLEPPPT